MSLFKKKIQFYPFLKELIAVQFDFWEKNFAALIDLADEAKVLTDSQRRDFLEKTSDLIIADIIMACDRHLGKKMIIEGVTLFVGMAYEAYLTECKDLSQAGAQQKKERVGEFLLLVSGTEREAQERDEHGKRTGYEPLYRVKKDTDRKRLCLCRAFSKYCVGEDVRSENYLDRNFAAFKFAKVLVQGDIVGRALKDYSITFR